MKRFIPLRLRRALRPFVTRLEMFARGPKAREYIEQLETDVLTLRRRVGKLEYCIHESDDESIEPEQARGVFEIIRHTDDGLNVEGWMLLPGSAFTSMALYVNGKKLAEDPVLMREDVARVFPFISNAARSGFQFEAPIRLDAETNMIEIRVVGIAGGHEIGKTETWYRTDLYSCLPAPPADVMRRETGGVDHAVFMILGLQSYREMWTAIRKHADPTSIKNMLDWGCGCGRVIGFFMKFSGIPDVHGCDIDTEAIGWCRENLKPGEFSVIPPYPPTSYPDNTFDLVVSFSVLTHLPRDVQLNWLREIKRILAPGGLFLTTVQGEFAAMFTFPGLKAKDALSGGIYDTLLDKSLDGIAQEGYYRSVFQTEAYTTSEYSRHFKVLEYTVGGANTFQDLVVMKKNG